MSNEIMNQTSSEISANHIYNCLLKGQACRLKFILQEIKSDYDNPSYEYVLRQCRSVQDLENFLKGYMHLFIVENHKVAKYCEKLETGQETADSFFEEKLKLYKYPLPIETLKKHMEDASEDIQCFIQTFYPEAEFKHYLKKRPHVFHVCESIVCLIERECAEYFRKIVNEAEGVPFMSLRGNVAQAPEHIRKHINDQYLGTEFHYFLEKNCDVFKVVPNGQVFLAK